MTFTMIVGLLSDTHGRLEPARAGVKLLLDGGATVLIHCGDVGESDIIDLLAGTESYFVFGNNDWDRVELAKYAQLAGVTCLGAAGDVTLDGKRAAVSHGDDHAVTRRVLDGQRHDYLFQGHTHLREDRTVGRVRVINPGALYRATVKTVALLDTRTGALRYIPVAT